MYTILRYDSLSHRYRLVLSVPPVSKQDGTDTGRSTKHDITNVGPSIPPSCPKEYICMIHQENIPHHYPTHQPPTCLYDRILGNVCALKDDLCSHTTQQRRVESARVIQ